MTPTLQILQVILFTIPTLALVGIGLAILCRTVSIVDHRWFLAVFIPLLLANALSILIDDSQSYNWRVWLILGADVILIAVAIYVARGYQINGLSPETVIQVLTDDLRQQGFIVEVSSTDRRDLWDKTKEASLITAEKSGRLDQFWVTARFNEVLVRTEQRRSSCCLRTSLPALQQVEVPYDFKAHAAGVLYIILALVFAVMTWIYFFEPRFILIE